MLLTYAELQARGWTDLLLSVADVLRLNPHAPQTRLFDADRVRHAATEGVGAFMMVDPQSLVPIMPTGNTQSAGARRLHAEHPRPQAT